MTHLSPTSRTDKNGVTVIRHMKPDASTARSPALLPPQAPSADYDAILRDELKEEITETLNGLMSKDLRGEGDRLKRMLRPILSTVQLEKILQITLALNESSGNHRYASYESDRFCEGVRRPRTVAVAYANLDIIRSSTSLNDGYMTLIDLHDAITQNSVDHPGTSDNPRLIERMDNHIYAYNFLRKDNDWRSPQDYLPYEPIVSAYPEHCMQLCDYLKARGGIDGFSFEVFNAYISSSAPSMAEGVL